MAQKTQLDSDDVARLLMVSPVKVCEWVQQGKLHAVVIDGGEHRFERHFDLDDVQQFAQEQGFTLSPPDRSRLRILVVDEDIRAARFLENLFSTLSETVEAQAVHNAFDAGSCIHTFRPDVVLLDLSAQDGIEVCRRIKSDPASRAARVIAMTAQPCVEITQRAMMAGAETCLAKPLDHQKLFDTIGLTLGSQGLAREAHPHTP
jgi:CheY-like chemotaxis protein